MQLPTTILLSEQMTTDSINLNDFNALYEKYCDPVYRNIVKLVKNDDDAEDILQEVFVSLWENRHRLRGRSLSGWLFIVSHNKAMDHLKKQVHASLDQYGWIEQLEDASSDGAEKEALYMEQLKMVSEAVDALPKRKKEVFRLCRLEGYSKDDVAQMMGISYQSVTDYLKQSNKAIKAYIIQNYPGVATFEWRQI